MIIVTLKASIRLRQKAYSPGDTLEVSPETAERWAAYGMAVIVEANNPKGGEGLSLNSEETATSPPLKPTNTSPEK